MTDIALRVENLSKRYRIGAKEEGCKTFERQGNNAFTSESNCDKQQAFQANPHGFSM